MPVTTTCPGDVSDYACMLMLQPLRFPPEECSWSTSATPALRAAPAPPVACRAVRPGRLCRLLFDRRGHEERQKGTAIVEFALVLPFLLLLTFITTEFGRAIWQYNTLAKSVRDAARYLSLQTPERTSPRRVT